MPCYWQPTAERQTSKASPKPQFPESQCCCYPDQLYFSVWILHSFKTHQQLKSNSPSSDVCGRETEGCETYGATPQPLFSLGSFFLTLEHSFLTILANKQLLKEHGWTTHAYFPLSWRKAVCQLVVIYFHKRRLGLLSCL